MKKIAVFLEFENNVSFELLSKAYELKKEAKEKKNEDFVVEGFLVKDSVNEEYIKKAYCAGAENFILIKPKNENSKAESFIEYIKLNPVDIILFPATQEGRYIAPKVTAKLDCGLVADCTGLEFIIKNDVLKLAPTRPTFGSELMATIISKKSPECATIRPKVFIENFNQNINGNYMEYSANCNIESTIKLISSVEQKTNEADFSKAEIIFTAGFGLYNGSDEYIKKLMELSKLHNAMFGATKKIVDYNLADKKYQIGQTGSTVTPKLYITFGVQGAIQHIMGMKNSKKIIAINTDTNADIFKYADYKIISDAKKIIDEMLTK